ncbi:uncharacterized protein si:dkey-195m11.11 [Colossoma macropomum]|uniref:uncharacterized protein si:dkey-195m11.11 n=1 Tax=Colossoma macropomum TaxID=42526 RepID=UPI0018647D95|nr:uncharacterized protein si:dkey-195m11.11 [Colossoma macropomum]
MVVNWVHVASQGSLPLPSLSLHPSANASDIEMFSTVKLLCAIPDKAPFPVAVFVSRADDPAENPEPWPKLQRAGTIPFPIIMKPGMEGAYVCWYKSTKTKENSGLSSSVDLFINSVPKPLMFLLPSPIFPVGGSYIAQCETPVNEIRNITLSLYERQLPLSPGNENFTFIGSRLLLPGEWGVTINRTKVVKSVEFACKMEVFYKGRVFQSTSSPMEAIPDELPAHLYSSTREKMSCAGYLLLRVKENWTPICFQNKYTNNENDLANIVCREANCGHVLRWNSHITTSMNAKAAPRCSGKENRIAECPIYNPKDCENKLLHVICSGALPPPKLSVKDHGSGPWVYIKSKESATLVCTLESHSMETNERIYLTITHKGQELTTSRTSSDITGNVWSIEYGVPTDKQEGEYACFARLSSQNSNSVYIYVYDPPSAGAIAAAVITTLVGAAVLIYICVFRTSEEVLLSEPAGAVPSSNIEISQPVLVRRPLCC